MVFQQNEGAKMSVRIRCKYCRRHLVIGDASLGEEVKCLACEGTFSTGKCVPEVPPLPNPNVACVLSAISPGLGFTYCGHHILGCLFSTMHGGIVVFAIVDAEARPMLLFAALMQLLFAYSARDLANSYYRFELTYILPPPATAAEVNQSEETLMQMLGRGANWLIKKLFRAGDETKD
ncbi:MAG: hypothetical protein ACO1RA_02495 [Planctomycetaceae bacterium]